MADSKNAHAASWQVGAFDVWRNEFDTAPPTYNSCINGSEVHSHPSDGIVDTGHEVSPCCAFERLNAITHPSNHHVFHRTPQLRLIGWILLCRAPDENLSREQRFSCPLASCDVQFAEDEHMQLVNHVSACRHLAEGEYLCPYHGTIENFMKPAAPSHSHRASKRHFLKRTIGKICRLGSRRQNQPGDVKSDAGDTEPEGRRMQFTGSNKRPRLDQISAPIISQPIIHAPVFPTSCNSQPTPTTSFQAPLVAGPVEISGHEILELEGWVGPTLTEPPRLDHYQELPAVEQVPSEMEAAPMYSSAWDVLDNRFSNSSWASASDSIFTSNTLSPISPISRDSMFSVDGFECALPRSDPTSCSNAFVSSVIPPPLADERAHAERIRDLSREALPPTIPAPVGRKSPNPIPSIRVDTSFNKGQDTGITASPASSSCSSLDSRFSDSSSWRRSDVFLHQEFEKEIVDTRSPESLVFELRSLFITLYEVSLKKLSSNPTNTASRKVLDWKMPPSLLFERGLRALQRLLGGQMSEDVIDIFSLSLLTYACGLADVDFTMPEQFSSIFEEQLRWSCAIKGHADREFYVDLVYQLWAPNDCVRPQLYELPTEVSRNGLLASSETTVTGLETWRQDLGLTVDSSHLPHISDFYQQFDQSQGDKSGGAAVSLCQRFLDNFEYLMVDLNELNVNVQASPDFGLDIQTEPIGSSTLNRDILLVHVIQPLATNPALQWFLPVIEKTSLLLETFPNMPLRNTELSLMQEGKECQASQLLRQIFMSEVRRLANAASDVLGCGNRYRSFYYSRDIEKILDLKDEIQLQRVGHQMTRSPSISLGKCCKDKTPATLSPIASQFSDSSVPSTPRHLGSFPPNAHSDSGEIDWFHSRAHSIEEPSFQGNHSFRTINPAELHLSIAAASISPTTSSSIPPSSPPCPTQSIRHPRKTTVQVKNGKSNPVVVGVSAMYDSAPRCPTSEQVASRSSAASDDIVPTTDDLASSATSASEKAIQNCHICGQRFEGKAQWIRANVTRHIREKHRGTARRLQCGEPRCRYTSTRKGNVDHHRRTVHGVDTT